MKTKIWLHHCLWSQIIIIFCLFFLYTNAFSAPPLYPIAGKKYPKDGVHRLPDIKALRAQGLTQKQIVKAIGTSGTKKLAVILVNFGAAGSSTSGANKITSDDITTAGLLISGLVQYYKENSYNTFIIDPYFILADGTRTQSSSTIATNNIYTLPNLMEYYGDSDDVQLLVGDAITLANTSQLTIPVNTVNYDVVMVLHAGYGEESTGATGDSWSAFQTFSRSYPTTNGFTEGTVAPVREKNADALGVTCHEFGHQLGLPDLYDTTNTSDQTRVGKWCIMDYGTWIDSGRKPSQLSAWCKKYLSWIEPALPTGTDIVLKNVENNQTGSCYKINISGVSTEYFLIEYRKKNSAPQISDLAIPGEGILVWHIDEAIINETVTVSGVADTRFNLNVINNDDTKHLSIRVEEADKNYNMRTSKGEATDVFFRSSDIFTTPQSDSYDLGATFITMSNFSGVGLDSMSMIITNFKSTTYLETKKIFAFPNPNRGANSSTIRMAFTRPFTSGQLKIYTVSGDLVLTQTINRNNFSSNISTDYSWIYDYSWNLKNDSGNDVTSGIYIYLVEAEIDGHKEIKTGKLAVIK